MDLGKATLVGLIDRLERRSYVVRRPDPSDRRIKHILLTDEGRELIAKIRAIVGTVNGKILRATSASDIARIEELMCATQRRVREGLTVCKARIRRLLPGIKQGETDVDPIWLFR